MLERFSRPRSFAHSEKRPLDGPIALLHIGLKRDVRHPAVRAGREAVLAGRALGTDSFLLSI